MKKSLLFILSCVVCFSSPSTPNSPYTVGQIISGTYTSGGTITGTVGQTCIATFTAPPGGVTSTATVALTGTNTIAGGTAIVITAPGSGYQTAPVAATFTSGSATCSGAGVVFATTLGTLNTLRWMVWQTGSNTNGMCFDPSLGGTDFSNQAAAQVVFSVGNSNLLSSVGGSTTLTSAGTPFLATQVGNCIQITGGTNFSASTIFEIVSFTDTSDVVLDRPPCVTTCTVGTGELGGAGATKDATTGVLLYQEGATLVYFKGNANYTGAIAVNIPAGIPGSPTIWRGFTTTLTDGGQATFAPSSLVGAGFINDSAYNNFENLTLEGTTSSNFITVGFNLGASPAVLKNTIVNHFVTNGYKCTNGDVRFINTVAQAGKSGCAGGYFTDAAVTYIGSIATGNPCSGFVNTGNGAKSVYFHTISYANSGATSHGYDMSGITANTGGDFLNVIAYNNGGAGIHCNAALSCDGLTVINSILEGNGTYGINSVVTNWAGNLPVNYIGTEGNTTADLNNITHGANDACASGCSITFSADAFSAAGSGNFGLNATANAGANLKGVGWPGLFPLGNSTGHLDIGAVQTNPASSGGCQSVCAQ